MELEFKLDSIHTAARQFVDLYKNITVFAFHGEMGAGKTTFISNLCEVMGVNGSISSPTFSIINEYAIPEGKLYHLDLYRLKNTEEAVQAGVEDVLYSGRKCFVEWPEQAPELFPADTLHVYISLLDRETRKISVAV